MRDGSKEDAERLFTQVMQNVSVPQAMHGAFMLDGNILHVRAHRFDLNQFKQAMVVSIGKASVPMAEHVLTVLRGVLPLTSLVVGQGMWAAPAGARYIQGDHPVPYTNSYRAAQELLEFVRSADANTLLLYLISGGASALAEAPLDPSITPEDMSAFYAHLLHAGLPIEKTNLLRKHFSAIKGGRLALAGGQATHCTLLISDVPPGKLDTVGSGPSLVDNSTAAECRQLLAETEHLLHLPESMRRFAESMPETPKILPEGRMPSACVSILSSDSLTEATCRIVSAEGYRVVVENTCDDWEYRAAAQHLVARAEKEAAKGTPLCVVSAGEVTVAIHGKAGAGGRNQQWALETARLIHGKTEYIAMSVGSDGIDGNSPAAGAVVDGTSWQRAELAGLDPQLALDSFNAYPLFSALGDTLAPGPSGNNLRDLRVIFVGARLEVAMRRRSRFPVRL